MAVRHGAALLSTGVCLGVLAASWLSATASFRGVDSVLGTNMRPELGALLSGLEPAERRLTLRHVAAEINRWMFRRLGALQLGVGLLALGLAWPSVPARWLLGVTVLIAIVQVSLGGVIESFGRSLDFLPRPLPADVGRRFGMLHAAFVLLDLGKMALLLAAGHGLARRPF
jgi:hypothetical protein